MSHPVIAVIGLGYVGAPLAYALAQKFEVVGYDLNADRIEELRSGKDRTHEVPCADLASARVRLTGRAEELARADIFIITVPTPVGSGNVPDLGPVRAASETVARVMQAGATVIYESTVYPGVTEEVCVPILEQLSGLRHKEQFNVGYSPERVNPGDKVHTLHTTTKIISADSPQTLELLDQVYSAITTTYRAPTIKVAEAAKVIENTQRDVNIALMNELSQIFSRLGVDTNDVINAAASKWNFLEFRPGLVGGHCISVDPYYLSHKAATQGFVADVILSAREINDSMASFVAAETIKLLARNRLLHGDTVVTVLGTTFKENVPDIRNSKVADVVRHLQQYGIAPQVIDPLANPQEVQHEYGFSLTPPEKARPADAIVYAVPHEEFTASGWGTVTAAAKPDQPVVVMDLKAALDRAFKPAHVHHWRP